MKEITYNKKRFVTNAEVIKKSLHMSTSDFETKLKVSKGYLSRLANNKDDVAPSAELVTNIRVLGKDHWTLDTLVGADTRFSSEQEYKLYRFILLLTEKTRDGRIQWFADDKEFLNDGADTKRHILQVSTEQLDTYKPIVGDIGSAESVDVCLHSLIDGKNKVYITKISKNFSKEHDEIDYEMFIVDENKKVEPVYSTKMPNEEIAILLRSLYRTAKLSLRNGRLDKEAYDYICDYLGPIFTADQIPF